MNDVLRWAESSEGENPDNFKKSDYESWKESPIMQDAWQDLENQTKQNFPEYASMMRPDTNNTNNKKTTNQQVWPVVYSGNNNSESQGNSWLTKDEIIKLNKLDIDDSDWTADDINKALSYIRSKYIEFQGGISLLGKVVSRVSTEVSNSDTISEIENQKDANIFQEKLIDKLGKLESWSVEKGFVWNKIISFNPKVWNYLIDVSDFEKRLAWKDIKDLWKEPKWIYTYILYLTEWKSNQDAKRIMQEKLINILWWATALNKIMINNSGDSHQPKAVEKIKELGIPRNDEKGFMDDVLDWFTKIKDEIVQSTGDIQDELNKTENFDSGKVNDKFNEIKEKVKVNDKLKKGEKSKANNEISNFTEETKNKLKDTLSQASTNLANSLITEGSTEEIKGLQKQAKIQEFKDDLKYNLDKENLTFENNSEFIKLIKNALKDSWLSEDQIEQKAEHIYEDIAKVIGEKAINVKNMSQIKELLKWKGLNDFDWMKDIIDTIAMLEKVKVLKKIDDLIKERKKLLQILQNPQNQTPEELEEINEEIIKSQNQLIKEQKKLWNLNINFVLINVLPEWFLEGFEILDKKEINEEFDRVQVQYKKYFDEINAKTQKSIQISEETVQAVNSWNMAKAISLNAKAEEQNNENVKQVEVQKTWQQLLLTWEWGESFTDSLGDVRTFDPWSRLIVSKVYNETKEQDEKLNKSEGNAAILIAIENHSSYDEIKETSEKLEEQQEIFDKYIEENTEEKETNIDFLKNDNIFSSDEQETKNNITMSESGLEFSEKDIQYVDGKYSIENPFKKEEWNESDEKIEWTTKKEFNVNFLNKFLWKELWFDGNLFFDMNVTNDFMKQNMWINLEWELLSPKDFTILTDIMSKHFMQLLDKQSDNDDPILRMIKKQLLFFPLKWIKQLNYYLLYNFEIKQSLWLPQDKDSWKKFFTTENFWKYDSLETGKFFEKKKDEYSVSVE